LAGVPAVSVPCGMIEGEKPFGLQFLGPQKGDGAVLQVAHAFEQVSPFGKAIPAIGRNES